MERLIAACEQPLITSTSYTTVLGELDRLGFVELEALWFTVNRISARIGFVDTNGPMFAKQLLDKYIEHEITFSLLQAAARNRAAILRQQQRDVERDPPSLTVKTLTGKTYTFHGCKTVDKLKRKFQKKDGCPPDQQRMLFRGKELEDGFDLSHYIDEDDVVIHMTYKLRGD